MMFRTGVVWAFLIFGMSGCTFKATTDTTTDGTTEFLSSTTGKTWWTEEGLVKQGNHAEAFVSVNYENLLQDIAQGEGEYLSAFGKILNVPSAHQQKFANRLQLRYTNLSDINVNQGDGQVKQFINQVVWVTTHPSLPQLIR